MIPYFRSDFQTACMDGNYANFTFPFCVFFCQQNSRSASSLLATVGVAKNIFPLVFLDSRGAFELCKDLAACEIDSFFFFFAF